MKIAMMAGGLIGWFWPEVSGKPAAGMAAGATDTQRAITAGIGVLAAHLLAGK